METNAPTGEAPVKIQQNLDSGIYHDGVAQEDTCFALTPDQLTAVELITRWYKARHTHPLWKRRFILAGPAGSGKSSIIKYIIHNLGLSSNSVLTCAYTGKAALNLLRKGNAGSCTLHHALYDAFYDHFTREWRFSPKAKLGYDLVIVDEASMVPAAMHDQLLAYNVPVLFIGDHCQLPPVDSAFNLMLDPDFTLTSIIRQAAESPIIRASQLAINGKPIPYCAFNGFRKIRASALCEADLLWAEQIVTGTNRLKDAFNAEARRARGHDGAVPRNGERMVVLKNNAKNNLFNGQIVIMTGESTRLDAPPRAFAGPFVDELEKESEVYSLVAGRAALDGREINYRLMNPALELNIKHLTNYAYLDYGYAISCHRAQGSGWDRVLVIDDGFGRDEDTKRRWLYTAITRAKKELLLVTM